MKRLFLVGLMMVLFLCLFAEKEPTKDEMNKMYLSRLDNKLEALTKVLGTYNSSMKNMKDIENLEYMNDFLFQMTLEIGKVRKLIIDSEEQNAEKRADAVTIAISSIKSDTEFDFGKEISDEIDKSNKIQLSELSSIFHKRLIAARKAKLKIEKQMTESKKLPFQYMDLLSQEFIYAYSLAFTDISSYLSKLDRAYLTAVMNSLADEIDEKNATKN
jgi:hypothetical protein